MNITIDQYIHQFNLEHKNDSEYSNLEKAANWIYEHPTVIKMIEIFGMVLGTSSVLLLPVSISTLGFGAIALAVTGGMIALVSFVAYRALAIIAPFHHDMQTHVFKLATFGVGKLYYQGNIPVLELQSDDPYEAGKAHGYLMGEPLDHLLNQLEWVRKLAQMPQANQVPETVEAIQNVLPEEYMKELEGIVDGFNQWSKENKWFKAKELTIADLILFHLMPDSLHFSPQIIEAQLEGKKIPAFRTREDLTALGCTVVIDQDEQEGLTFGRNMDWPSFGLFGTYSLIINRKYQDEKLSTVELGFPGFVGTLTGMNKAGLSLAMNVCSGNTDHVQGIPAAFFNRMCLERCQDIQEVEELMEQDVPLGSYHLSVADPVSAKSFHFYQGSAHDHVIREWQVGETLITTNCQYLSQSHEGNHMHCSRERKQLIQELFNQAQDSIAEDQFSHAKLVEASLALPYVNNSITTHKIVMYPQSKKVQLAVDNAFAGQAKLHTLDTTTLLA